jgi:hypothetical protein
MSEEENIRKKFYCKRCSLELPTWVNLNNNLTAGGYYNWRKITPSVSSDFFKTLEIHQVLSESKNPELIFIFYDYDFDLKNANNINNYLYEYIVAYQKYTSGIPHGKIKNIIISIKLEQLLEIIKTNNIYSNVL